MKDRRRLISETQGAGFKSRVSGQTNAPANAAFPRASNRHTGRVEHDATYRKQRTGCMSTRHRREEVNRSNPGDAKLAGKPMSAQ